MKQFVRPDFPKAFWGLSQKQVIDYMSSLESELEISDVQMEKAAKELETLRAENTRMSNQLVTLRSDVDYLQEENRELLRANQELEDQLLTAREEKTAKQTNTELLEQLQAQNDALRKEAESVKAAHQALEESAHQLAEQNRLLSEQLQNQEEELAAFRRSQQNDLDPKTIQDAILNAQRMSTIILNEANEKAAELKAEAENAYQDSMNAMDAQIREKQQHADLIVSDAEKKCEDLQKEYDHILLDVSGFKQEMIGLYRKHLQMLYQLPDNGSVKNEILEMEETTEGNAS